jgi:RNA polymerase sigma-70 factor, ECF subfamily
MEATSPQQMASVEYSDLCAALAKLDPKPREALMLVAASGFSYGEAASLCGCPVGTVKSRVNRARTELARMLSIDGPEDFEADAVFSAAIASADRVPAQA